MYTLVIEDIDGRKTPKAFTNFDSIFVFLEKLKDEEVFWTMAKKIIIYKKPTHFYDQPILVKEIVVAQELTEEEPEIQFNDEDVQKFLGLMTRKRLFPWG